jgi:amino acid permease
MDAQVPLLPPAAAYHDELPDPMPLTRPGSSVFHAAMSIFNIVMGIGVLSLPYAMSRSGGAGLLSVMLCCFLFCMSGKCIAWSMEYLPAGRPQSYPQLGREAMGTFGQRLVTVCAVLDLTGGSCIMMIVLWRSLNARPVSIFLYTVGFLASSYQCTENRSVHWQLAGRELKILDIDNINPDHSS